MTQVKLVRKSGEGTVETVCWTDADPRLKVNNQIRLKNETEWWTIAAVYSTTERAYLHRNWHVGGL